MTDLVKVKGLKGKQNKKKWAKNIDVSELISARARQHDAEIRQTFRTELEVVDDNANNRLPLDPNRFKNRPLSLPKQKFDNKITRNIDLKVQDDPWAIPDQGKHKYKQIEIPAVIIPESGHSYNPRDIDIEKLEDRVIDFEKARPRVLKIKPEKQLPVIQIRHRNKKKRAAQLEARAREEEKQFKQQLHNIKRLKKELNEKEEKIELGIKTKQIKKEADRKEILTGRVRRRRMGRRIYRFKQYIPEGEKVDQVSKLELNDQLVKERFDSIYRRGMFEPRSIKVHANKRKHIKVKERAFLE